MLVRNGMLPLNCVIQILITGQCLLILMQAITTFNCSMFFRWCRNFDHMQQPHHTPRKRDTNIIINSNLTHAISFHIFEISDLCFRFKSSKHWKCTISTQRHGLSAAFLFKHKLTFFSWLFEASKWVCTYAYRGNSHVNRIRKRKETVHNKKPLFLILVSWKHATFATGSCGIFDSNFNSICIQNCIAMYISSEHRI